MSTTVVESKGDSGEKNRISTERREVQKYSRKETSTSTGLQENDIVVTPGGITGVKVI